MEERLGNTGLDVHSNEYNTLSSGDDDVLSGTYLNRLQGVTCWKIQVLFVVLFYSKSQKKS
jgi:hypothetical protein